MLKKLHSVVLDKDKCIGCTDCIKRCPTEAIRVRDSKAVITEERCIDCGMCIRVCRNQAKKASTDRFDRIHYYEYKVAIVAPTLYSQFKNIYDPNVILTGVKRLGFDEVFEVAEAAEIISDYSNKIISANITRKPVISSACPAVVRLIQMRFPSLIPNLMPVISPMEATARYAKNYLSKKGIPDEKIGIFFISPCAAKVTDTRNPSVVNESHVDGVISIKEIYVRLLSEIKKIEEPEILMTSSYQGISWAKIGGEGSNTKLDDYISVDGIENVINVLERIEDNKAEVDFVECLACINGCLGGPLALEDAYVAVNNFDKVKKHINENCKLRDISLYNEDISLDWEKPLKTIRVHMLDNDKNKALEKVELMESIFETLPQIDCGSCGAPTCRALAEDIVRGKAKIDDCIIMLRKEYNRIIEENIPKYTKKI